MERLILYSNRGFVWWKPKLVFLIVQVRQNSVFIPKSQAKENGEREESKLTGAESKRKWARKEARGSLDEPIEVGYSKSYGAHCQSIMQYLGSHRAYQSPRLRFLLFGWTRRSRPGLARSTEYNSSSPGSNDVGSFERIQTRMAWHEDQNKRCFHTIFSRRFWLLLPLIRRNLVARITLWYLQNSFVSFHEL